MADTDHGGKCGYTSLNDHVCPFPPSDGSALCFWHDPNADKSGKDVGPKLVKLVSEKHDCQGFELSGVDLRRMPLRDARMTRINFQGANLDKANLDGAGLFGANLADASMFKANLNNASLRSANLDGANILGATLQGARMEGADFGDDRLVVNERHARDADNAKETRRYWQEAEEIYLELNQNYHAAGRSDEAGEMYYRFMVARRMLMPRNRLRRHLSWLMDVTCGYGEQPFRVVAAYIAIIIVCAALYFFLGISTSHSIHVGELWTDEPELVRYNPSASVGANLSELFTCLYFSIITITTTGYGDMTPTIAARPVAATEAFLGTLLIAMLVMVIGRRTMRG